MTSLLTAPLYQVPAPAKAGGVPRQINLVCTMALLAGMIDKKEVIDEATIRKVVADMDRN